MLKSLSAAKHHCNFAASILVMFFKLFLSLFYSMCNPKEQQQKKKIKKSMQSMQEHCKVKYK